MHPRESVELADVGNPGPPPSGETNPYTWMTPQSTWGLHRPAIRHHNIALPNKLEGRFAQLVQLARGDLLSTQALAYFMEAVLHAAVGYQALHLPDPQDTLRHARQQVTKARPSPRRP